MKNEDIEETLEALQRTAGTVQNGPDKIDDFDETLFSELVDRIVARSKSSVCFHLNGGVELTEVLL